MLLCLHSPSAWIAPSSTPDIQDGFAEGRWPQDIASQHIVTSHPSVMGISRIAVLMFFGCAVFGVAQTITFGFSDFVSSLADQMFPGKQQV